LLAGDGLLVIAGTLIVEVGVAAGTTGPTGAELRAAVREGLLAETMEEKVLAGGVRERVKVVGARGMLISGAPLGEAAIGCLRTLTAAEDALTVDWTRLGSTGALGLSTREGRGF
jgi:hypothetical protein